MVFSYLRRCCKQEVREWLKSRLGELSGKETTFDLSEGRIAQILLSLPPELRPTAEGFAVGKSQTQIAEELKLDPRTVYRHKITLKRKLGTVLFCRWIESAMSGSNP
jgi:DNA-binding NarL/FixJ family response regulator